MLNNTLSLEHSQQYFVVPAKQYKTIPLEHIEMARKNRPFQNIGFVNYQNDNTQQELGNFKATYTHFLNRTFPNILQQVNIQDYKQQDAFKKTYTSFSGTFATQAAQLKDAFESGASMLGFFEKFEGYLDKKQADFKNINALKLGIETFVKTVPEGNQVKSRLFNALNTLIQIKTNAGITEIPEVLPLENLAEIALAFPVWYYEYNRKTDYIPRKPLQPLLNLYGTGNIYDSHLALAFAHYDSTDVIPFDVVQNLKEISSLFDNLYIATPYHDIASKCWNTEIFWQRNIDPVLLGFINGCNYFVVIRRWSGSGVFPKTTEMIADTMHHLESHLSVLRHEETKNYVQTLLQQYKAGTLIDFLKK